MSDDSPGEEDEGTSGRARYKLGRVFDEYDLDDLEVEVVAAWSGESEDRRSLRDLASDVNLALLREELRRADVDILEGEVANLYRLLTDDDVSRGMREQARGRLIDYGIDVDRLEANFASHRAVHTYLTEHHGVQYDPADDSSTSERSIRTIQRLRRRLITVTEDAIDRHRDDDWLSLGEFDVIVDVRVLCRDCGWTSGINEVFAGDGCDCK